MTATASARKRSIVEKSPILAQLKSHTMQSNFRSGSPKTFDAAAYELTHDSHVKKTPESGQR
jgi:hypothetical protein